MKILLYVGGFNLYYSAVKGTPLRWLNPVELAAPAFPRMIIEVALALDARTGLRRN
jgi:hypothetical protein